MAKIEKINLTERTQRNNETKNEQRKTTKNFQNKKT